MGKTYRKYGNQLCKSDSYHEDKNRGWRKKKIRSINHSLRNKNREKDELDFNNKPESPPFDSISDKKIINFTYMGGGKKSMNFNHSIDNLYDDSKWEKGDLRENLQNIVDEDHFYKICLKQLDRRKNIGVFKGHNKGDKYFNHVYED